ncbi:MAG: hypothetical protein ACK4S0_13650 [Sediminibacterium sp.]
MKKWIIHKDFIPGFLLIAFTSCLVACVIAFCDNGPQQAIEISTTHFITLI